MTNTPILKTRPIVLGVVGLAINDKGQVLLTQRHQPQDPDVHLCWQIPGGGMEFGESPEQTLAREMQEELGVSVRILYPHPIAKTSIFAAKMPFHVTLLCYLVSIDDQTPTLNDPETAAWKWMTLGEAAKLHSLPLTMEFIQEATALPHA